MCFSWKSESEEKPFKLKKQQKFVLLSRQTNVVLSCRSQSRKSSWQAPPPSRTISFFPRSAAVSGWRLSWKPEDGLGASAPSGGEPTYLWGCRIMLVMEGGRAVLLLHWWIWASGSAGSDRLSCYGPVVLRSSRWTDLNRLVSEQHLLHRRRRVHVCLEQNFWHLEETFQWFSNH